MRKLFVGLAAGAALLLSGATAQAGPLVSATFTLSLGTLPPAVFTAAGPLGGTASGTGPTAAWTLLAGAVPGGTTTAPVPLSAAPPISKIQFILSGNPSAAAFSAGTANTMPVTGTANILAYGGITLLAVPLVIGLPTTQTPAPAYGVGITAFANSWTSGATTITLTTATSMGATTAMVTGANLLAGGGGALVLVSALNVVTNLAGQLPAFAILQLGFVPEPGTLLLVGSGVAGLVLLGRRKRDSR